MIVYIPRPALCEDCGEPLFCEECGEPLEELLPIEVGEKLGADLQRLAALQALRRAIEEEAAQCPGISRPLATVVGPPAPK